MNKTLWEKIGIAILSIFATTYGLFLILPFIINPIIDKYSPNIIQEIKKASGLEAKLEDVKIITTPKLTAGIKVKTFQLLTPKNENIISTDDFQLKISLLPLFAKKIELDVIQLNNADINLHINKDGSFEALNYMPECENKGEQAKTEPVSFPFTLSNRLPDIKLNGYKITVTDGLEKYILSGEKTEITDFILDKSIKIKAKGKAVLKSREQFNYDIKIFNKIMPELSLNDLVFNPQTEQESQPEFEPIEILGVLNAIYTSNLTANAIADLKIEKNNIQGHTEISDISIINLPKSNINLKFSGNKISINSDIYTALNERSSINGTIKHGKNANIDMNIKSKVEIGNILKIIKEFALIFNVKDLQTLTANGELNADFNIKSDFKTVQSNGCLNIPNANIYYGLYKIAINKINADILLDNNNINIKNIGFSILNQPLKLYGTINEKAVSDLHLTAEKLNFKGLLVAFGQSFLMKENQVNSGTVSMNIDIAGPLDKINPVIKINLDNIDIKNIPSNTVLKAPSTNLNITSDGKTFGGNAKSLNIKILNPVLNISIPALNANILPDMIEITQTPVTIEKIKTSVRGKIKNYMTPLMNLDFVTSGDIKSKLSGDINLNKQTLNLNYSTTEQSSIIIPMFDKSNMSFNTNINILGSMLNPILKGNISIPVVNIPEIPVNLINLDAKLNGTILHGSGSVQKFTSGGIAAENLVSDFELRGENFYLQNLTGNAFDGKVKGNIIYNIMNAKTSIDFAGEGLNATKAVYGATGIKNALTGTLGFRTKIILTVLDYNDMIRSIKGNLNFNVKNGAFGSIGKIDNFFKANNIVNNALLKNTVSTLTNNARLSDTAIFDYIEGNMTFNNGWAELKPIKSAGKSLSYYVTGKVNLINFSTNVNILGRLDAPIVAKLGVIGQLSADKVLSYIPVLGSKTATIINALTTNPKNEKTELIPQLTNGSTNTKDFKVVFNGGLESTGSIKSFKWLTDVDTSAIETKTVKETIETIKTSVSTDVTSTVQNVKDVLTSQKEDFNATKEQLKNSVDEIRNLFKK